MEIKCLNCGDIIVDKDLDSLIKDDYLCDICKILKDAGKMPVFEKQKKKKIFKLDTMMKIKDLEKKKTIRKKKKTKVFYKCTNLECGEKLYFLPWDKKCPNCNSNLKSYKEK